MRWLRKQAESMAEEMAAAYRDGFTSGFQLLRSNDAPYLGRRHIFDAYYRGRADGMRAYGKTSGIHS